MNTEIMGLVAQILLVAALSYPLGKYIARVYKGEKTCLDFLKPVERLMFRLSGIDPEAEMDWKQFLRALLGINLLWFLWGMAILLAQTYLPLNPDANPAPSFHLALNTCVSFLVNCNLQHYSGESALSYFTQIFVVMLFQFLTAATGMAAMAGVMRALASGTARSIGNFWRFLVLSCTRILLPLALILGSILLVEGVPMNFDGKKELVTLEGRVQNVSQGPVAAIVPIKQLGTNGGGFFGANAAHPLENPSYLTDMVECSAMLLIPMAMVFAFGCYVNRRRLGHTIFAVMFAAFILGVVVNTHEETAGNPRLAALGIRQDSGAMEGKEVRFGPAATALWSVATTATSNGSTNGQQASLMPLSATTCLLNMQINAWFGGVGVGWLNYFTYLVIAVFISGLMVGRTPELLGKKIEASEMKIASLVTLLHPFLILSGTALAAWLCLHAPAFVSGEGGWTAGRGAHDLATIFYEFTSAAANNGSGFENLGDNTPFWDYACAFVLLLGRYLPIVGQVALAGLLASKQHVPETPGTLRTDTVTFAAVTFCIIVVVAALSFLPALSLTTLAEHFAG